MPWKIQESEGNYCLVKEGSTTPVKGGCHGTREEAQKHQAALYAAEEKGLPVEDREPENLYKEMMGYGWHYVPYGITSFKELDASRAAQETAENLQELTSDYTQLVRNITGTPEVDIAQAVTALTQEYTQRVNSVKTAKKSFLATLKEKITPKKPKAGTQDDEEEDPAPAAACKDNGMMVWKETDGLYHFIARYSNNLRDNDNPPEIISAASHARFVAMVENKELDLPEVWLWHVPEWKCGQVDWVTWDYDEEKAVGFALAGGHFDKEAGWVAEKMATLGTVGVSHGMPKNSLMRDKDDNSIIVEHITREISPLPAWAAANKWADFTATKESSMIPESKKNALIKEWGLDPAQLAALEAKNTSTAGKALESGIESKEKEAEAAPASVSEETPAEPPVAPVLTTDVVAEIASALKEILTPVLARVSAIEDRLKELAQEETDEETRMAQQVKQVPTASLGSLLVKSIIGEQATRVDGRTGLAKSKPTLPADMKKEVATGEQSLLGGVIGNIIAEHTHN